MASPWALPVGSVICQTSHRAAPGAQLPMGWLATDRSSWLAGAVPSTAAEAPVGKLTFRAGNHAVTFVEKELVPVGSM